MAIPSKRMTGVASKPLAGKLRPPDHPDEPSGINLDAVQETVEERPIEWNALKLHQRMESDAESRTITVSQGSRRSIGILRSRLPSTSFIVTGSPVDRSVAA